MVYNRLDWSSGIMLTSRLYTSERTYRVSIAPIRQSECLDEPAVLDSHSQLRAVCHAQLLVTAYVSGGLHQPSAILRSHFMSWGFVRGVVLWVRAYIRILGWGVRGEGGAGGGRSHFQKSLVCMLGGSPDSLLPISMLRISMNAMLKRCGQAATSSYRLTP